MDKSIDKVLLERWRALDATVVLQAIADVAKPDATFHPVKILHTCGRYASVFGHEFELLLTGSKFWGTRAGVSGGGAVDLVMHWRARTLRLRSKSSDIDSSISLA